MLIKLFELFKKKKKLIHDPILYFLGHTMALSKLKEDLLYIAVFGTSHARRTFDDCNDEGAAGVGGLTMQQVNYHYHVDSFSGSSQKLNNIGHYFQELMRNPLDCLIIQIGDNDVAPYCKRAKSSLAQGEQLDPYKVVFEISHDIILLARRMKLDFGASRVVLLPLMPRYYVVRGMLTQEEV